MSPCTDDSYKCGHLHHCCESLQSTLKIVNALYLVTKFVEKITWNREANFSRAQKLIMDRRPPIQRFKKNMLNEFPILFKYLILKKNTYQATRFQRPSEQFLPKIRLARNRERSLGLQIDPNEIKTPLNKELKEDLIRT